MSVIDDKTVADINTAKECLKNKIKESDDLIKSIKQELDSRRPILNNLEGVKNKSIELKKYFFNLQKFFFNEGNKNGIYYKWADSARLSYDLHQNYENQLTYEIQKIHNDKVIRDAEKSLIKSRWFFIGGIAATALFSIFSIKSVYDNKFTECKLNKIQTTTNTIRYNIDSINYNIDTINYNIDSINKKLDSIMHIQNQQLIKQK